MDLKVKLYSRVNPSNARLKLFEVIVMVFLFSLFLFYGISLNRFQTKENNCIVHCAFIVEKKRQTRLSSDFSLSLSLSKFRKLIMD